MTARYGSQPFTEAISAFRAKLNTPTESWDEVWGEAHNRAFMVAGAMKTDLLADLRQAVDSAIAQGKSLKWFQSEFANIADKHGWAYNGSESWRSELIYQTNIRQTYNAGREAQMQALKHRRPYGLYQHGDSLHPREHHLAWHNLVLPLDDPWWQTHSPTNGYGCKCKKYSLSERDLKRRGLSVGKAPKSESYDWVDKKTGEVKQVPVGIDPGFEYRPMSLGQANLQLKKKLESKPPLAERLPERIMPSAYSTCNGVTAQGMDKLLEQLPDETRLPLVEFLKQKQTKTLFIKQNEMGKGQAMRKVQKPIAEYLGKEERMAPLYYRHRTPARVGGFTSVSYDHVVVKVKSSQKLKKVALAEVQQAAVQVLQDARNNNGPFAFRLPGTENLKRHFTVSSHIKKQVSEDAAILSTWLHELGHQIHYYTEALEIPAGVEWLTAYGTQSKHEFFAETFAAWVLAPEELTQWQPKLAEWMANAITTAIKSTNKKR